MLSGALVGTGVTPEVAVASLLVQADDLVIEGHNFFTNGPIDLADRTWLFKLLDTAGLPGHIEARYVAIREALGHDPYGVCSCHLFSQAKEATSP
jgi:hypothetical protein